MTSLMVETQGRSTWRGLLRLMRPKQWVKNTFVLAPLVFSGTFLQVVSVGSALRAMVLFCLASSLTYVLNDYHDIEADRAHPTKRLKRPLASGEVSKPAAIALALFLAGLLASGAVIVPSVMAVIAGYVALNIAYAWVLKHQPVLDIFVISTGFVLRVHAGAVALDVPVSSWMFISTFCLALYLAAMKRRQELQIQGSDARKVLQFYSVGLIDRYAQMAATGALVFYSMFVLTARPQLVITIPVVLYGLFRYFFIVDTLSKGESPTEALLSDKPLLGTVLLWGGLCIWAIGFWGGGV